MQGQNSFPSLPLDTTKLKDKYSNVASLLFAGIKVEWPKGVGSFRLLLLGQDRLFCDYYCDEVTIMFWQQANGGWWR